MPHNSSDTAIEDFLRSYTAPADDNGFTAMIMAKADAEVSRLARLRRRILNGACFVGGIGTAAQLPKLWGVLTGLSVPKISVPDMSALNVSNLDVSALDMNTMSPSMLYAVIGGVMVAVMMIWALWADQLS